MFENTSWHKITDYITDLDFGSNNIAIASVRGKKICVAQFAGKYFAFAFN